LRPDSRDACWRQDSHAVQLDRHIATIEDWLAAEPKLTALAIVNIGRSDWRGFDTGEIATVRRSLQKKVTNDPDFWSVVRLTEFLQSSGRYPEGSGRREVESERSADAGLAADY
jgi:hypothetical protein